MLHERRRIGALAVGVVAAGAAKDQPAGAGAPAAGPAPQTAADQATDAARTSADAEAKAEAALPQCRAARLVPVNSSWGIPMPSIYGSTSTTSPGVRISNISPVG